GVTPRLLGIVTSAGYDLVVASQRVPDATDGWVWACDACAREIAVDAELGALGAALRRVHAGLAAAFGTHLVAGDEVRAHMLERLHAARDAAPELDPYADGLASG